MPDRIKLAVLGGGSVASPELIRALGERAARLPREVGLLGRTGCKSATDFVAATRVTDDAPISYIRYHICCRRTQTGFLFEEHVSCLTESNSPSSAAAASPRQRIL